MVRSVVMPKLGQSVEEGKLVQWRKHEGEPVAKGDVLFEIETDKALLEVESFYDGTLLKILVAEGDTVPVQTAVAFVGEPGEPLPEVTPPPAEPRKTEAPPAQAKAAGQAEPKPAARVARAPAARPSTGQGAAQPQAEPAPLSAAAPEIFKISPRAAKLAEQSVIDPMPITGSGPGGRIVERDVIAYLEAQGYGERRITPTAKKLAARESIDVLSLRPEARASRITRADVETVIAERPKPMSRMRQVIAERLTESYTHAPHFFVTVSVDLTELESFRTGLKARGISYTITDFILKAAAMALEEFPTVNSITDGKSVRWHSGIHLGFAVAMEQGLVVPVIRKANELALAEIHERASKLTAKAREGKLAPDEMTGSTFTISNMGMMDVENFTAIINPGESAILAVSSGRKQPVVKDDRVAIRLMMKMTLSSDHRIVDGALAARFVNAIRNKLEEISLWQRSI